MEHVYVAGGIDRLGAIVSPIANVSDTASGPNPKR